MVDPTRPPGGFATATEPRERLSSKRDVTTTLLAWYILFGALHEVSHAIAAFALGVADGFFDDGWFVVFYRTILGRHCVLPALNDVDDEADVIRFAGWTFSVALASVLLLCAAAWRRREGKEGKDNGRGGWPWSGMDAACLAATVVAIEALSTDLLRLPAWSLVSFGRPVDGSGAPGATFFCGNFGIILLNSAWMTTDGGKTALSVLEKMIEVTMMRGAQSGGVVTFKKKQGPWQGQLTGIRSRVVNMKRTDLSKGVKAKIERDNLHLADDCVGANPLVKAFCGHTRFATSSKATLEGTHPHVWSPPSLRRVYNFGKDARSQQKVNGFSPEIFQVCNFITHNGDLDFYEINGTNYDLEMIQKWLEIATEHLMPATVDSAAIAGLVDLLRTQGCFGLSVRYAVCFALATSKMTDMRDEAQMPTYRQCEEAGMIFEAALEDMLKEGKATLHDIASNPTQRKQLIARTLQRLRQPSYGILLRPLDAYLTDDEGPANLHAFASVTIDAFFDNDLFQTTRLFMRNASGSFGLCVTTTLDAHRQICLAARGQTACVAFYPKKGLICYGSEQAAVKAGLNFDTPGGDLESDPNDDADERAVRLDLDDLGGEICLLDWGGGDDGPAISLPNKHLPVYREMHSSVHVVLKQESKTTRQEIDLFRRMTLLEGNEFVSQLQENTSDLVLTDIQDIPRVCRAIQEDWRNNPRGTISLNRLTAWNLSRALRRRMDDHVSGKLQRHAGTVDVLVTGCEVSLWLAEQFASDLQKSFPRLGIQPVSANKILGLFGQELSVPTVGYPMSQRTHDWQEAIVIIVSHSGGTFSSLACSNLLQGTSRNIFVVASEWDTQVGKQLRTMNDDGMHFYNSRTFTTDVGVRPAEPCSVSVAATQQLLTQIFEHICIVILSNADYRRESGAVITDADLEVLERCNQDNIRALEKIVGVDSHGERLDAAKSRTERELRRAGNLWADHVLENASAYMFSFLYIVGTVTAGYPLITGVARAIGLDADSWGMYLTRFFDALIYFWLPQINILLLRMIQGRNLRHRMVGRTVVIGDCPWVAQSAEAFLSKIFACSYSIAGVNVLSGNPADHLVHRHTHRVVRGSLLVCGRPDGRLSALSSLEMSACLSVNQASSIQSIGGTCESVTIGHNPYKLPLSKTAVFLDRERPLFLCERVLGEIDVEKELKRRTLRSQLRAKEAENHKKHRSSLGGSSKGEKRRGLMPRRKSGDSDEEGGIVQSRSSGSLMGSYTSLAHESKQKKTGTKRDYRSGHTMEDVIEDMIEERSGVSNLRKIFDEIDTDKGGTLDPDEFVAAYAKVDPSLSREQVLKIFEESDEDKNGTLDFDEFVKVANMPQMNMLAMLQTHNRDDSGLVQVKASKEQYFGQRTRKEAPESVCAFAMSASQHFSMELYESRVASLQRFVSMCVMFHQMGKQVQEFFPKISLGRLGYRMDRTHSIMRIATTASPVSGADVRERMKVLQLTMKVQQSVKVISHAWLRYKEGVRASGHSTNRNVMNGESNGLNNSFGDARVQLHDGMDGSIETTGSSTAPESFVDEDFVIS